jgi:DNA polymerase III alpha subunit
MKFNTIEDVIDNIPMNIKAANCLGKAGAFINLEEDLNELEASKYVQDLIEFKREYKKHLIRLEKYNNSIINKEILFKEKLEVRRAKQNIKEEKYQERLLKYEKRLKEVEDKNLIKKAKNQRLLKIPLPPKKAIILKDITPLKLPDKPQFSNDLIKPRIILSSRERIRLQREMLHIYISGHPLDNIPNDDKITNIKYLSEKDDKTWCTIKGVLQSIKIINTRKKTLMCKLRIEDKTGTVEVVLFPKIYKSLKGILEKEGIYEILGRIDKKEIDTDSSKEYIHTQFMGTKIKRIQIGSDKEWDFYYPLLKGCLRILPGKIQKSKELALNLIKNTPRQKIGGLIGSL